MKVQISSLLFFLLCLAPPTVSAATAVDYLIIHATLITEDAAQKTVPDGAVAIQGDKILDLGESAKLKELYRAKNEIDAHDGIVVPGFVNTHTHLSTVALRGMVDTTDLGRWWRELVWPTEKQFISRDFTVSLAVLGIADQLRNGVTTVNDMSFFSDAVAEAAALMGLRGYFGETLVSQETPAYATMAQALDRVHRVQNLGVANGRILAAVTPHGLYNIRPDDLKTAVSFAKKNRLLFHMHLDESDSDTQFVLKTFKKNSLRVLEDFDVPPGSIMAHGVKMSADKMKIFKRLGLFLSTNVTSNQTLATGAAPLERYLSAGVPITLGTDGPITNSADSFLEDMRNLERSYQPRSSSHGRRSLFSDKQILRWGTADGARALRLGDKIGSLESGKRADLVVVEWPAEKRVNILAPEELLVKTAATANVRYVFVDGRVLIRQGEFTDDLKKLIETHGKVVAKRLPQIRESYLKNSQKHLTPFPAKEHMSSHGRN